VTTTEENSTRAKRQNPAVGTVEHPDEMIYLVRNEVGDVVDVGMEEFVSLERMTNKYLKLTLIGKDETKPLVLILESDSKINVRELGVK